VLNLVQHPFLAWHVTGPILQIQHEMIRASA
jgi:hypothetical protein